MSIYIHKLSFIILNFLLFFHFVHSLKSFESSSKLKDEKIKQENKIDNAIYVIRNYNGDKNLDLEKKIPTFLDNPKKPLKKHFRIFAINEKTKKKSDTINPNDYYCIEDKDFHLRLGIINNSGDIGLQSPRGNDDKIDDNFIWKIIPVLIEKSEEKKKYKKVYYYLQNKASKNYLNYVDNKNKGSIICNSYDPKRLNNNNLFIFNKMYRERNPKESLKLIESEPIDVLIKYIDLSDPNLEREGINQIKKDEENGEIKYSVRSILKNIPWIRKIFILMPNERVKYFKEPNIIKDKIVYVKDKDLLGFDSASSPAFQFNLWRMKQFGLSENFILMDDDCFIGKPLKKSDFFYEENGKIYPALITADYYELSKNKLEKTLKPLLDKIRKTGSHSANGFSIMQKSTLIFLYSIFGDDNTRNGNPLIEAAFTHNAIPVKQSDLKEIYDYIVKLYPYYKETLEAKERHIRSLQPQTLYLSYVKNKYDQRVKIITSRFFDLIHFRGKVDTGLFVINTSDRKYQQRYFDNEIKLLNKIYPEMSPYELKETEINKNNKKNNKKINNKNQDKNKNKDIIKDKSKVNINFYEEVMDFFKYTLNEKKNYNSDLLEIKNNIDILNNKYEKALKKVEELTNKLNDAINRNVTLNINIENKSYKYKLLEILILIMIIFCFILYLNKKGYFNENNIQNINSFENISEEKEMNLIESKLDI